MTIPDAARSLIGRRLDEVPTPALLLDLDALEYNIALLSELTKRAGLGHRPHAKGHKSIEIARRQLKAGALGICCQKISEAEVFVAAGIGNILITNELVDPIKIEKACALARDAQIMLVADDPRMLSEIDKAASKAGAQMNVLIEIDLGQNRCGVSSIEEAVALAKRAADLKHIKFGGVQAYQGKLQHVSGWVQREAIVKKTTALLSDYLAALEGEGLSCEIVTGGGTGTLEADCELKTYTDVQPGSYVVMDAQYKAIGGRTSGPFALFRHALTLLSQVISVRKDWFVLDAGLKAMSSDAGQPEVIGRNDVSYSFAGDEHGILRSDSGAALQLGERIAIIPGHCDTTINLYDYYLVHQGDRVVDIWPIDARGRIA
jgi:D-serine deaminase-like pyridoxal phosphate-dependent protein